MVNQVAADVLLDRADAARAAGRGEVAAGLYDQAAAICRTAGDLDRWTRAVLGAAAVQLFGAEPGKLPAQLYDVLARTTDDATRARLAAALARCWAYAGQVSRAVQFADEAIERAARLDAPDLLADCLHNDLQAPAMHLQPGLAATLEVGERSGALAGLVSGSGPTVAFLVADIDAALEVQVALSAAGLVAVRATGPVHGARVVH